VQFANKSASPREVDFPPALGFEPIHESLRVDGITELVDHLGKQVAAVHASRVRAKLLFLALHLFSGFPGRCWGYHEVQTSKGMYQLYKMVRLYIAIERGTCCCRDVICQI
jgi:hypothetical protein